MGLQALFHEGNDLIYQSCGGHEQGITKAAASVIAVVQTEQQT